MLRDQLIAVFGLSNVPDLETGLQDMETESPGVGTVIEEQQSRLIDYFFPDCSGHSISDFDYDENDFEDAMHNKLLQLDNDTGYRKLNRNLTDTDVSGLLSIAIGKGESIKVGENIQQQQKSF